MESSREQAAVEKRFYAPHPSRPNDIFLAVMHSRLSRVIACLLPVQKIAFA